jgi:hypothetical protein
MPGCSRLDLASMLAMAELAKPHLGVIPLRVSGPE